MRFLPFFLLLLLVGRLSAQSTLESIPNQKLIDNSYVSNPDKILDDATVTRIDSLLGALEKQTSVQVAVVAVRSIGTNDIFDFSQQLFVTWGIGTKGKDNGLLLLLVEDQRTVRFHTGFGLEGTLPDVICKRIQRDYMVPEFKNGDYNAGIFNGLQQVNHILTDTEYANELKSAEDHSVRGWTVFLIVFSILFFPTVLVLFIINSVDGGFADSKEHEGTPYPEMRMKRVPWLLVYVGIPLLIIAVYGFSQTRYPATLCILSLYLYAIAILCLRLWKMQKVISRLEPTQDYRELVTFFEKQQIFWLIMAILVPLPFLPYFFYHRSRKRAFRDHPRKCKECQGTMSKFSEATEDEFLSKEQQMEEKLGSVDYDVWKCESCQCIEALFYPNHESEYKPCPKCKTIALGFVSSRTTKQATYASTGSAVHTNKCKFCGHTTKTIHTLPQRVRSSSISSDSSSSSSDSGSSSSGGSWGGGDSGGGGSSSSW